MLLNFRQEQVDMMAAMLLPVFKDGFTLIKEQQSIMNLGFPAHTEMGVSSNWHNNKHASPLLLPSQQQVIMVTAMPLPVFKDGFALIKNSKASRILSSLHTKKT